MTYSRDKENWRVQCHEIVHELRSEEIEWKGTKEKRYQLFCTIADRSREHHGFGLRRQSRQEIAAHPVMLLTGALPYNNTYKFIAVKLLENIRQLPYNTPTITLLMLLVRILYTSISEEDAKSDQTTGASLSRAHCHLGVDSACLTLSKWRR